MNKKYLLNIILFLGINLLLNNFFLNNNLHAQFINPIASVTGSVIDSKTEAPMEVQLDLFDENDKQVNSTKSVLNENGHYFLTGLKPGKKYYLSINLPEYNKEKYEFEVPELEKYLEIKKDFLMTKFVKKEAKSGKSKSKSTKSSKTGKKTKTKKATNEKSKG